MISYGAITFPEDGSVKLPTLTDPIEGNLRVSDWGVGKGLAASNLWQQNMGSQIGTLHNTKVLDAWGVGKQLVTFDARSVDIDLFDGSVGQYWKASDWGVGKGIQQAANF